MPPSADLRVREREAEALVKTLILLLADKERVDTAGHAVFDTVRAQQFRRVTTGAGKPNRYRPVTRD
jgi:hypothetical protein